MNRPLRRTVFATAALTAGLLMTACQSGTDDNSSGSAGSPSTSSSATASSSPSSSATTGTDSASGSDTSQGTQATPPGSSDADSSGSSDSGSDSDSGSSGTVVEGLNDGKGVSGTWFGNVSYLAPGKYTVSDSKGTEQQFFTAEDTKIIGYDDICDAINTGPGGEGGVECTEAQLETAAKKGFSAEVVISNGIATSIRDDN
ncbi:hypothetical protein [Streptomyces adonidis]|uniref:hypothetical protein n=1 Tax=Streptomyces adonidis TaxID=3231367 RepID=UPI0034DB4A1B